MLYLPSESPLPRGLPLDYPPPLPPELHKHPILTSGMECNSRSFYLCNIMFVVNLSVLEKRKLT
jgi:hypothetical protein